MRGSFSYRMSYQKFSRYSYVTLRRRIVSSTTLFSRYCVSSRSFNSSTRDAQDIHYQSGEDHVRCAGSCAFAEVVWYTVKEREMMQMFLLF